MSRPQNLCVYCGKPGVTKEHYRGAWSNKHAPLKHTRTEHIVSLPIDSDPNLVFSREKGPGSRPGAPRSQTLKIACKSCNTGWMKKIVDKSIPILTNMNYGYWGNPEQEDIIALASWITLYTMSHEFVDRPTVCISPKERSEFMESCIPSLHWNIAIGCTDTALWNDRTFHRSFYVVGAIPNNINPKAQITVFQFGRLLALSSYAEFNIDIDFDKYAKSMDLSPIWPSVPKRLSKPFGVHSDASVDIIVSRMTDIFNGRRLSRPIYQYVAIIYLNSIDKYQRPIQLSICRKETETSPYPYPA